jgi:hypothetical protein
MSSSIDDSFIYKAVFRFIAIAVCSIALSANIHKTVFMKNPSVQMFASIMVLLIIVFIDEWAGFLFAAALLVLYFRIFLELKQTSKLEKKRGDETNPYGNTGSETMMNKATLGSGKPYITPENLNDAQTNVFSLANFDTHIGAFEEDSYTVITKNAYDKNEKHFVLV